MTKPKKTPKPSLLITVDFNPRKEKYLDFFMGAIIEYCGVYFDYTKLKPSLHQISGLFEKNEDGEEFYKMVQDAKFNVIKTEC